MPKPKEPSAGTALPVILFPLHGCRDVQEMTHEEYEQTMRKHRVNLRKHWKHDGVKSMIAILELTTMRLMSEAMSANTTEDQICSLRRASGASEQLVMLRTILTGQEQDSDPVA